MSDQLQAAADARREGFSLRETLRDDREWVRCYSCRKQHPLRGNNAEHDYQDFAARHPAERGCLVVRLQPDYMERIVRREERRRRNFRLSEKFSDNASVLLAFQSTDQSLTITALNSLGSSATAGWGSGSIDNSSNLYLDYLFAVTFSLVNTAPSSDKAFYFFGATALNTTDLPSTGAAAIGTTQAALTFPSISTLACALPLIKAIPYPVQNVAIQTPLMSIARVPDFGGQLGLYVWVAVLNFSGMVIAASGNAIKYRGVYNVIQ